MNQASNGVLQSSILACHGCHDGIRIVSNGRNVRLPIHDQHDLTQLK
jgi:hypothetical protein